MSSTSVKIPVLNTIPEVSVVIPVYRGEKTIGMLAERLKHVFEKTATSFELIFVEDCGGDRAWDIIKTLSAADQRIHGMKLLKNYGQHNALLCGIRKATGDVIVTLDDDLQNPPEEIFGLLAKLREGYDVVYGAPINETHGFFRNTASQITKIFLSRAMGADVAARVSAFRVFRSRLKKAFEQNQSPWVSIDVLLTWGASRYAVVKVRQDQRTAGVSGYTMRKLVRHAFNMLTGFSTIPLKIASLVGFFFSLFGVGVLTYVLIRYMLEGTSVQGFPFLASVIAIFSGAQLFALGIMGEYLARIYFRTMDQPPYIVDDEI